MREIVGAGLLSVGLAGLVGCAHSSGPSPLDATNPAQAAETGPPSVDWTVGQLLDDPPAKAVLAKDMPGLLAYPGLDSIHGMTIRMISKFPQSNLNPARLAKINADLAASHAPAPATP